MTLILIEAPDAEPVTLAAVKAHLSVEANEFDDLLAGYISAVRAHVEEITGRALVAQSWELRLGCFPPFITLPLPPLLTVNGVTYLDGDGAAQTLDPGQYQVAGVGGSQPGRLMPAFGQRWPATRSVAEAVTIQFTCGYLDGDSPPSANVPPAIKAAIMELVADLWSQRETISDAQIYLATTPTTAKSLLAPYRVWSLP